MDVKDTLSCLPFDASFGSLPLTSAWPPGFNVLLQRSHFRQNLCQSFPKDDTFSAAEEEEEEEDEEFLSICTVKVQCYMVYGVYGTFTPSKTGIWIQLR